MTTAKNLASTFADTISKIMGEVNNHTLDHLKSKVIEFYPTITKYIDIDDILFIRFHDKSVFILVEGDVLTVTDFAGNFDRVAYVLPQLHDRRVYDHIKGALVDKEKRIFKKWLKNPNRQGIKTCYISMGDVGWGSRFNSIPIDPSGIRLAHRQKEDLTVVNALEKYTEGPLYLSDYVRWMYGEGEGNAKPIKRVIKTFLGKKSYRAAKHLGCLPEFLKFKLGLSPSKGRIKFTT